MELLFLSKEGPTGGKIPEIWDLRFAPLWQMTEAESAELRNKQADTDVKYLQAGVVLPEEIGLSRFRPEGWSAETQIDREARESLLEDVEESLEGDPAAAETEGQEDPSPAEEKASGGKVVLAPTDIAIVVTVNEARASQGLSPWPNKEEGQLTVAEFKARKEAEGTEVGAAEGEAAAEEISPTPETPTPPPFVNLPETPEDGQETEPETE